MTDHLARWISILFDSSFLSLPIFLALGYVSAGTSGLLWAALMFVIVTGIPLAYLLIGRKRGWVSDMELSRREERPRFILVSLSSDVLALVVLWLGNGPHLLRLIILTYFCLAIVMFTISSFWKISMHMASVGGFATALVFVFGVPALWVILSLPLVAWARLHRRKHDIPQLIAGALAGALTTALVFSWLNKWI
ncbi:MAG: hypothetical protein Q8L41_14825 [Anaerolineales bacterium]|nr:hypothetical protein [Anaerolineales bacterium]